MRKLRSFEIGVASALLVACSPLLESDELGFRQVDGRSAPKPFRLSHYLKTPALQEHAWFGFVLGADTRGLVATAPFESVTSGGVTLESAGSVYLFDRSALDEPPTRITTPNVDANDGNVPTDLLSSEVLDVPEFAGLGAALTENYLTVSNPAEDSSSWDPFDNQAPESGAVWVFDRKDLSKQPQYVKALAIHAGDLLGFGTTQSGDWLALGAPGDDEPSVASSAQAEDSGVVYLYKRQNERFEPHSVLKPHDLKAGDWFGCYVVLSDDVLVVGALGQDAVDGAGATLLGVGAIYIYRRVAEQWQLETRIPNPLVRELSNFGTILALSGNVLAVSAPGSPGCDPEDPAATYRGSVYIFTEHDHQWQFEQCVAPRTTGRVEEFGLSLALSGDTLVVGAPFNSSASADDPFDTSALASGAVSIFRRNAEGRWIDTQYLKAPNASEKDFFGFWVTATPGFVAVGAPIEDNSNPNPGPLFESADTSAPQAGAVYVYTEEP